MNFSQSLKTALTMSSISIKLDKFAIDQIHFGTASAKISGRLNFGCGGRI